MQSTTNTCCYSRGQLGHGHTNTVEAPQLVETLDGVTIQHISCGGWHSVALAGMYVIVGQVCVKNQIQLIIVIDLQSNLHI